MTSMIIVWVKMAEVFNYFVVIILIREAFIYLVAKQVEFAPQIVKILFANKEPMVDPIIDKRRIKYFELLRSQFA